MQGGAAAASFGDGDAGGTPMGRKRPVASVGVDDQAPVPCKSLWF